jgi:hypothetical protein
VACAHGGRGAGGGRGDAVRAALRPRARRVPMLIAVEAASRASYQVSRAGPACTQ